jgi:hypothetical protein
MYNDIFVILTSFDAEIKIEQIMLITDKYKRLI